MRRGFWEGGMDWVPKGTDSELGMELESDWWMESESESELGFGEGDMGGLYHSWVCLSVAFALVLFKGTRLRNRLALYDDGRKTSRA